MNQERIALKQILEGLVHNLNNPLNLILGYAQRLRQIDPECQEAERIYKAGIAIDDALKEITMKLWSNSFGLSEELNLGAWLSGELKYLQHYLPIKHYVQFVREDMAELPAVLASPLSLSIWYESILGAVMKNTERLQIRTGICRHKDKAALYLALPEEMKEFPDFSQIDQNSGYSELYRAAKITSEWDATSRHIYGVLE